MTAWTLRFGASPAGVAWVVQSEDGAGPAMVFPPEAFEEARSALVRRAFTDGVPALLWTVALEDGEARVDVDLLDR